FPTRRSSDLVHGNLYVRYSGIESLEGLNNLRSVEGSFEISQTDITSIDNVFTNLESVSGSIYIHLARDLTYIDDFHNLNSLGGFTITQSDNIQSIVGFDSVESTNDITIRYANKLEEINAFQNLKNINDGGFHLSTMLPSQFQPELQIVPLGQLESISGLLHIRSTSLSDLNWLGNLNTLNGGFWISGNEALNDFSGLSNLESLNAEIVLSANGGSLNGFDNV